MDKKYEIFISSPKEDLQKERKKIQETLLSMDCIPHNMELFYATNLSPLQYIERSLSSCDFCLIIVAAKYGSICEQTEKSYTHMEYEYAKNLNIPMGCFLHKQPDSLPFSLHDESLESQRKLNYFRKEMQDDQTVKYWTNIDELCCLIAVSVHQFIILDINKNKESQNTNNKTNLFNKLIKPVSLLASSINFGINQNSKENYIINPTKLKNKNLLKMREIANIILSQGLIAISELLGICIKADLIKVYLSRNLREAKEIINPQYGLTYLFQFKGKIFGKFIIKIQETYFEYLCNIIKFNYSIDLLRSSSKLIESFFQELGNMYISYCLSSITFFIDSKKDYIRVANCEKEINFNSLNKRMQIYQLDSKDPNLLSAYLLLDEDAYFTLLKYINLYEDSFKYLGKNNI